MQGEHSLAGRGCTRQLADHDAQAMRCGHSLPCVLQAAILGQDVVDYHQTLVAHLLQTLQDEDACVARANAAWLFLLEGRSEPISAYFTGCYF